MVWYEHANPNQTTTLAMEQREKKMSVIKSTHSEEVDKQIDRL